jgi:FAD:protein FMN transferase
MHYTQKQFDGNRKLLYAWFQAMHTRIDLIVHTGDESIDLMDFVEKAGKETERIEAFANRFDENSELSHINQNAFTQVVPVSEELFKMLSDCQQFHRQSSGYFDISINSTNNLTEGMKYLELDSETQTVRFQHEDLKLDLSGYLKGYALGKMLGLVQLGGIENALINFGNSSVYALGNHPYGKGWKINSEANDLPIDQVLSNECLTTSGFRESREWPVKNPLTGAAPGKGKQVSVLTSDPVVGEVVSKIACLAKKEELEELLKRFNAQIVDIRKSEN